MSDLYGDLYADLEPKRFKYTTTPNPLLLALGTAWEQHLEFLITTSGLEVVRPGELMTGEGVAYSPDGVMVEDFRLVEYKYSSMGTKDLPAGPSTSFPQRFNKYMCVEPETPILRSNLTWAAAEDLQPGDRVIGFDEHCSAGHYRHLRHSTVEHVQVISKPTSELILEDGTRVSSSLDHLWLVGQSNLGSWLRTDRLLETDRVANHGRPRTSNSSLCRVTPSAWTTCLSEYERGWLAGIADGEGCLHSRRGYGCLRLTLAQKRGPVLNQIVALLQKDGFNWAEGGSDTCVSLNISNKDDVWRFLATIRPLRLLARFEELTDLAGLRYSTVPVVFRSSAQKRRVVAIQTSTRTYLAGGLASHNCQMMCYCHHLGTPRARLYFCSTNRPYDPELLVFDIDFTARELLENWQAVRNNAKHKGLLR